jgi:hypothetical protein
LFVLGLLILIPSGLCSALMGLAAIAELFSSPGNGDGAGFLSTVVMVGGPFILVGGALVYAALRARRNS